MAGALLLTGGGEKVRGGGRGGGGKRLLSTQTIHVVLQITRRQVIVAQGGNDQIQVGQFLGNIRLEGPLGCFVFAR